LSVGLLRRIISTVVALTLVKARGGTLDRGDGTRPDFNDTGSIDVLTSTTLLSTSLAKILVA
jgi:hypothetical protein